MNYFSCLVVASPCIFKFFSMPRQWLADWAMFPAQEWKNASPGALNSSFGGPQKATYPNMSPKIRTMLLRLALVPVAAIVLAVAGCTSSLTNGTQSNVQRWLSLRGWHRRASLPAVVGFQVQLTSITATRPTAPRRRRPDQQCTPAYRGLCTLQRTCRPAGRHEPRSAGYLHRVTFVLGTGTIDYLNVPTGWLGAPTIATIGGDSTVHRTRLPLTLANPLMVAPRAASQWACAWISIWPSRSRIERNTGELHCGHGESDLDVSTVTRTDTGAHIDEFFGSVVTATNPARLLQRGAQFVRDHGSARRAVHHQDHLARRSGTAARSLLA